MSETLKARQEMREVAQLHEGVRKYHEKFEGRGAGESTAGLGLVYVAMRAMVPWIQEKVRLLELPYEEAKAANVLPSQVPAAVHWLAEMQADAVAYIAAKLFVSAAYNEANVTRTAMKVANLIEENYRYEELEQAEPALANSMSRKAQRWARSSTRRRIMRKAAEVAGIKRMGWTEQEKVKLGFKLMEVFVETTGFAVMVTQSDPDKGGKHQQRVIRLSDEARDRLVKNHEQLENQHPENRPMIHPPKPWTSPTSGGYLTEFLRQPILRGTHFRKVTEGLLDELYSTDLTQVYDAVNAVQATPWRVNKSVYNVMREAHRLDMDLDGVLPMMENLELPPMPADMPDRSVRYEDQDEGQRAIVAKWKQEARTVHRANAVETSHRYALMTKLAQVADVVDEEAIYFPHALDFRGRLYPLSAELSPQSDDISKGLLEFAEGRPLGENGSFWLAVHIANLFGHDKIPFEERVEWVLANEDKIADSAVRPLDGEKFWTTADDPWCALAACFEWTGFRTTDNSYVSHIPVAMDGTCSGIQHFSAMLRDQRGGEAVNLVANETPADIYIEVLDVLKAKLNESKEPLAKVWYDKVDRKMVKRPCMTFAYSVTSAGIKNQLLDEMRKRGSAQFLPGTNDWDAAVFLAPLLEESIRDVVDRAAEAMDWLKGVSKAVSKNDIPTGWTTPLGFRVVQPYLKSKGQRIKVLFQGQPILVSLTFEGDKIDTLKQASAVAPNFVHSLDATHLMMTVNRLKAEGVTHSFAVIHDSFGVHAADVDELHAVLREEFVNLYTEQEVLVDFYQESLLRLPGTQWPEVDSPPEAGDLNLEEVRDADFFFA